MKWGFAPGVAAAGRHGRNDAPAPGLPQLDTQDAGSRLGSTGACARIARAVSEPQRRAVSLAENSKTLKRNRG